MIESDKKEYIKSYSSNFSAAPNATEQSVKETPTNVAPARTYKFTLDTFQQEAVNFIEKGESVLVAAHTSAGKTAVAEYAIAKSLRDGQRVIYTSPIKALSNQKFRDLQEEFQDVGLMTGDMTINPNATCLIMTTEILRSMLYRGAEILREVAWVIYDEVHYMRDKERGVVWEESIILLPHKVRFVFLSATIPNAKEFVGWVSALHHQPCHVVYTEYRPVPLQHFLFPAAAEGLYLVVDEQGRFREDNFQKAMNLLQPVPEETTTGSGKKSRPPKPTKQLSSDLLRVVKLVMDRELDPCIVFSFSKKDCESYALQMARMDFNSEEEKDVVEQVFLNAMEALSEDDKVLPQVVTILPLLKRGVGIHHGGLLPILKEVIEILFQEGLIKCLFATETFSIGINMPAKTVVFTRARKFDGKESRWITSGEYIQMSGRAGRRGKDDKGIVIQMLDEKMEPEVAKGMIYGASDPLMSSYHVSFNMVLNMLRVEDANPENLVKSSFYQFQQEKDAPLLELQADELEREASAVSVAEEALVAESQSWLALRRQARREVSAEVMQPQRCLPFLQLGRLVFVAAGDRVWGWAAVKRVLKGTAARGVNLPFVGRDGVFSEGGSDAAEDFVVELFLEVRLTAGGDERSVASVFAQSEQAAVEECKESGRTQKKRKVEAAGESGSSVKLLLVSLGAIEALSAIRLTIPHGGTHPSAAAAVQKSLREVLRRFQAPTPESPEAFEEGEERGNVPLLDPVEAQGLAEGAFRALLQRCEDLSSRLALSRQALQQRLPARKDRLQALQSYAVKMRLREQGSALRVKARESQVAVMKDELRKMKKVLRRLDYISSEGVLGLKGKFSCELSTGDEIVLTNMVFDGVFNDLTADQTVGLLSCFVHKEPGKETGPIEERSLQGPYRQLQAAARSVASLFLEHQLISDEEEYVKTFNPALADVGAEEPSSPTSAS